MLGGCRACRFFARLAATSAAEFSRRQPHDHAQGASLTPWIDDAAARQAAREAHIASPEYKELHKPAMTTSAMGLFGGEPGFEKAHRVWVDPDRPQVKHIFNQTVLARNLRYARYGYFKRDMHLLDIDKLVRHARLLPTPNRLLTDFLYQRVPLPDHSCAALMRYQREQIEMLAAWHKDSSLVCAEEMFERMAVTNIPPVEVGVETHAEMIRCCAACQAWHKGWEVYYRRARELEQDSQRDGTDSFTLNTALFDAVMELCVACERPEEGLDILAETVRRHLRPRTTMLDKALLLASLHIERYDGRMATTDDASTVPEIARRKPNVEHNLDVWTLYDFYALPRTSCSFECYLRLCATAGTVPTLLHQATAAAESTQIALSLEAYSWLLYGLRIVPAMGDYIMELFARLGSRGLQPDYVLFTYAFMYCDVQRDGELAMTIYEQYLTPADVNPTPEMTLLFVQACVRSAEPQVAMLHCCEAMIQRLERVGSVVDCLCDIYDQYIELAALLGAVESAFSRVKQLMSFGKPVTTRQMNSLLLANAYAPSPNGSVAMTVELVRLFQLLHLPANDDTLHCLRLCVEAHGQEESTVQPWGALLEARQAASVGRSLGLDADLPVMQLPPHRLRQLHTEWKLRPRDTALRRFGQFTRAPPKLQAGSIIGSIIPFGRSPGEKSV